MHASDLPIATFANLHRIPVSKWEPVGCVDMLLPKMHQHKYEYLIRSKGVETMNYFFRTLLGLHRNRLLRTATGKPAGRPTGSSFEDDLLCRTRYQPPGEDLRRISLRFDEVTYIELKMLSLATGCSMSSILVAMIIWEYKRRVKLTQRAWSFPDYQVVGTPTINTVCMVYNEADRSVYIVSHFEASEPLIPR